MAYEVVVPRLGWSMEEGTLGDWLKNEGEAVKPGDPLFVLEGEKATQDIESLDAGILRYLPGGPQPGELVRVGQLLGYLVAEGETPPFEEAGFSLPDLAPEPSIPAPTSSPLASTTTTTRAGRVAITPRARRAARQNDVDWTLLTGTGRGGRIRERDILAALDNIPSPDSRLPGHVEPLSPVRQVIARRLASANLDSPTVTLFRTLRGEQLVARRKTEGSGYTSQVIYHVSRALRAHPVMNSSWSNEGIFFPDDVNIAFAVDTDAGLLAPIIQQADNLTLAELDELCQRLSDRAQAGTLSQDDLRGGTFTVSSLGMHGVQHFTPLLNPPQCATLGIGTISPQPVVEDGSVIAGQLLHLSLTFDHRIVDGAPAARFLDDLCERISQEP